MRRLVASGLLPERAGQPVKVWAHVSLAELRALDDGSVLAQEWVGEMAVRWAARRAAASQAGSDGAAWLDGKPARALACDASVIPVVTGGIDPGALDDLVALCLQYAGHGPHCGSAAGQSNGPDPTGQPQGPRAEDPPGEPSPAPYPAGGPPGPGPRPPTAQAQEMLRHAIIGKTMDFLLHYIDACDLRLHPRTSSRQMSVALEGSDPCHTPGSPQPHPRPRAAQRFGLGTSRG